MDSEDKRNLYEVNELQDYDNDFGKFTTQPPVKTNEQGSNIKLAMFCLIGIMAVMFITLIILLGVTAVIMARLNTLPVCDNSQQQSSTGGLTSGTNSSSSNSTRELYSRIDQILNTTLSLLNYRDNDTAILQDVNDLLTAKFGQLLSVTQGTASKVDDIYSFTDQQGVYNENVTDALKTVLQTTGDSAQKLINIVGTLSALTDTSTSTAGVIDDILLVVSQLLELQNGSSLFLFNSKTPVSCNDIKTTLPHSPTGYYRINGRNVYCNMDTLCGSGGGWTRLAYLNMNDSTMDCPSGFRLSLAGGVRVCGRQLTGASCVSVQFPSTGINYSQICGKVVGYQFGTTDAIDTSLGNNHNNLNSWYVDGVSITRGSPRQHVWTLMAAVSETSSNRFGCPCSTTYTGGGVQSFIGNNYFCESGNPNSNTLYQFYPGDLLWDGQGCGSNETPCCSTPGIPWFHRDYGNTTTTDYIELRVCGDQSTGLEDSPVNYYEIYVK